MFKTNFVEVFPSKWSIFLFIIYMALFVSQGLLVTYSQESSNNYKYNTVVAVLLTEFLKLILSIAGYYTRNRPSLSILEQCINHHKVLFLYFVPSFLYCLSNNLSYVNLLNFDPATYVILFQLKVVISAILFQIIFSKILTCLQWFSLIMLTIGCMIKNVDFEDFYGVDKSTINVPLENGHNSTSAKMDGIGLNYKTSLMLIQILSSCFAGVYCEYLIKIKGLEINIFIQNFFMHFDSIVCNIFVLGVLHDASIFSETSFHEITQLLVLLIIINSAVAGIVTSFFLKYLNSILKNISSALELIFITIFSWMLFNVPIKFSTMLSISVVTISICLYSQNPVRNPPKPEQQEHKIETI